MLPKSEKIWINGKFVAWDDAKFHVLAHGLHYGSSVFEGIRCYNTSEGPAVFRLKEHVKRFFDSAKIYRMMPDFSINDICNAIIQTIRINRTEECYIRPIIFRGYGGLKVNGSKNPIETVIAAWKWGAYIEGDPNEGAKVRISSWNRMAPNTHPFMAKAGGNYQNAQLAVMEAVQDGYVEAIMLDVNGFVSEGSGENIFIVKDGQISTPSIDSCILPGITRNSVITIANEAGHEVKERRIPREELYIADEVFFVGTAAEITPISEIDHIRIGDGKCGKVTRELRNSFFKIIKDAEKHKEWLTFVEER